MAKGLSFIASIFFFITAASAADPVQQWIETSSSATADAEPSLAWNPGNWWLDETEVRLEVDDKGVSAQQSLRVSLKPLLGLPQELKFSNQRDKVRKIIKDLSLQEKKLHSYIDVLNAWRLSHVVDVIKKSAPVYNKSKSSLKRLMGESSNTFDKAKFISDLATYSGKKAAVDIKYIKLKNHLLSKKRVPSIYLSRLKKYSFVNFKDIVISINKNISSGMVLENEQKQLKYHQLKQKKNEAYQLLKFVSVSREEKQRREDYKFQVSIRVPFLSDGEELKQAQSEYLLASHRLKMSTLKKQKEVSQLKSQIIGLIDKSRVLSYLPKKSGVYRKLLNNLINIPQALKEEQSFLKARLDQVETDFQIYQLYLLYLFKTGQFSDENKKMLLTTI